MIKAALTHSERNVVTPFPPQDSSCARTKAPDVRILSLENGTTIEEDISRTAAFISSGLRFVTDSRKYKVDQSVEVSVSASSDDKEQSGIADVIYVIQSHRSVFLIGLRWSEQSGLQ